MLQIDKVQTIEGVTVYGDDKKIEKFYVVPEQARYRRNPDGTLAFKFMKYRRPVDRGGEKPAGGGFCLFDSEFVVEEAKLERVKEVLQTQVNRRAQNLNVDAPPVRIGTITYTEGTVSLIVADAGGTFVEKIKNVGKPSLFGKNIASFGLELTQDGARFFEQAMQGQGGAVSVVYDLKFWAKLPPIKIDSSFYASKFYSFFQKVDIDWQFWGEDSYDETIREMMISSESVNTEFDWGGVTDEAIRGPIRDWAMKSLEDAIERNMIAAIVPVPDDQREMPDGIEHLTRNISDTRISSFSLHYKENQSVEWNIVPQGILQNITSLNDNNGNLFLWEDYSQIIDLDDPFFRMLRVNAYANADFDTLPIHSVEVKVLYNGTPMPNLVAGQPEGEALLKSVTDVGKFATFIESDNWDYAYSYQINYKGESRVFQSPEVQTNEGNLTIGVDDVGILTVDVSAGDLNWTDVDSALVTFEYDDPGANVDLIKDQFTLTQSQPSHQIQEIIFEPMRKSYRYSVKYFMNNGKEVQGGVIEDRSANLFINDVFGGRKTIGIRGVGDFANRINKIFLDVVYSDTQNDYVQTHSVALSNDKQFDDWSFPVISETAGTVEYSGNVVYSDGTVEKIEKTLAEGNTILVPEPVEDSLTVTVVADLLDWSVVKLARVDLSYVDADNGINERKTMLFSSSKTAEQQWVVELRDKMQQTYQSTVTYFMSDNSRVVDGPNDQTTDTLLLEVAP